jgi:hypothetical protein
VQSFGGSHAFHPGVIAPSAEIPVDLSAQSFAVSRSAAPSFAAPQEPAHGFRSFLDGSLSTGGPVEPREPRQKPSGEKSAKADPAVTTVQVPVVPPPPRPLAFGLGLLDYSGAQALSPDETDLSNGSVSQLDSASLPQAPDSKVDSGKESPAGREAPASDLAFAARLLADQSESPDENTPTNQRGASNSPAAVQRDVASPAAIVTKSATASGDRSADYLAGNASGGQAYVDSIGTPAAPASATQDAPPSAPAQTSNVAPPAQVEPPEPAVQPVSRDLSLHLGDGPHGVDIRMAERAGEIKVTVHTPGSRSGRLFTCRPPGSGRQVAPDRVPGGSLAPPLPARKRMPDAGMARTRHRLRNIRQVAAERAASAIRSNSSLRTNPAGPGNGNRVKAPHRSPHI